MPMSQMGEFSLYITKIGLEQGVVVSYLYPIVATATVITSFIAPYIIRSADSIADYIDRHSPKMLNAYVTRLSEWLETLRTNMGSDSVASHITRHTVRTIAINIVIVVVIASLGNFVFPYMESIAGFLNLRRDAVGLILGLLLLMLCIPFLWTIWKNVRNLADEAAALVLSKRLSLKARRLQALRVVMRDSIVMMLTVLIGLWFIPFFSGMITIGSLAIVMPAFLVTMIIYLVLRSVFDIHDQMERAFSRALIGKEHSSVSGDTGLSGVFRKLVYGSVGIIRIAVTGKTHSERQYTDNGPMRNTDDSSKGESEKRD
jgi:CPA2 family monovalent cation:H+ antiporter-2